MTDADLSAAREALPSEWKRAFDWVERELGGRITRFERQARWRPAWFLDLERNGETVPLYWRGDRGEADHGVYPLDHEYRVLQVLEAHDIPVPHPYGFCEEPRGMLLARAPGRANLATAESEAERDSVQDHYMELLARMHQIDLAAFEAIGLERPKTEEQLGLGDFDSWEKAYRGFKCRPEPWIEFAIRWIRRNVPKGRDQPSFLTCDAGQFLFEAGRVTCVLDLELAYLGDPAADLAGMRCRDLSEPLGSLARAVSRYEEFSGQSIDRRVIDYHSVRFGLCTPMVCAHLVTNPSADVSFAQYLAWYLVYGRCPLEIIAELEGVEIPSPELPDASPSRYTPAHDYVLASLKEDEPDTRSYEMDQTLRAAQYARRADLYGRELEAQDLDEAEKILGQRPANAAECDAALEAFVLDAEPVRDAELVRYFTRHILRQEFLLGPAARELEGVHFQPISG